MFAGSPPSSATINLEETESDVVDIQLPAIIDINKDSFDVEIKGDSDYFTFDKLSSILTMDVTDLREIKKSETFDITLLVTDEKGYNT